MKPKELESLVRRVIREELSRLGAGPLPLRGQEQCANADDLSQLPDRFSSKVLIGLGGCWCWQASRNRKGYGQYSIKGRPVLAHRWAYEQLRGPIPDGMHIDHLCRVRHCVNPEHMEPVTPAENFHRGKRWS